MVDLPAELAVQPYAYPEHVVWLAIALAGLWFLDDWYPNEVVRFIA